MGQGEHQSRREAKKVLVVGADPVLVTRISVILEDQDYIVATAANVHDALSSTVRNPAHLAIIDASVVTSQMDGWELCRRLRETSELSIIMITASNRVADRIKGLSLGADDCIATPFHPQELLLRVEAILRRTALQHRGQNSLPLLTGICG